MNPPPPSGDDQCDYETDVRSVDDALAILQHRYRRAVIEYFSAAESRTAELDELVEHVVRKHGTGEGADEREQIAVKLHHVHLPQLAAQGVVEWDPRTGQVRYEPDDHLEKWLARIETADSE